MKKVIFLVLFLNSFLFSAYTTTCTNGFNIATSYLTTSSLSSDTKVTNYIPGYFCSDVTTTVYKYVNCYSNAYGFYCRVQQYNHFPNYTCPNPGEEVINTVCAVPPTCATGTLWNPLTDTCEYDPNTADADGDGIPDKCDPDYVDYLTMDCDGDLQLNTYDNDIDGDGILNGNDPTPYGANSGTADAPCPSTSYTLTSVKEQGSCSMDNPLFNMPDGELRYISNVIWDDCRKSCMVLVKTCPYGQAIKNGICQSLKPDEGSCLGTSSCGIVSWGVSPSMSCVKKCNCLTTLDPVPSATNEYFNEEVSCSEQPTEQDKLDDLRENSDVNKTLPTDLLQDSNATYDLDVSASMKVALDSYAGAKEATQQDLLTESRIQSLQLVSANTNLQNIQSTLENFSATSTSNDGVINGTLNEIDSGIDTSNALLTDIKDNSEAIKNNLEGKNSDGTLVDTSSVDSNFANVDSFFTDVQSGFTNIANSYTDLTANIEQGFQYSAPTGTSVATTVNVFGKNITFDISSVLVQLSPIIYYFMYISMFILAIKLIFLGFMVV